MKRLEGMEKGGPLRSLQQGPRHSKYRLNVTESGLLRAATRSVRNQAYLILFHPLRVMLEKKKKNKTNYTAFILNP